MAELDLEWETTWTAALGEALLERHPGVEWTWRGRRTVSSGMRRSSGVCGRSLG